MDTSRRSFLVRGAGAASLLAGVAESGSPLGAASGDQSNVKDYFPPPDLQGGWRSLSDPSRVRKMAGIDVRRLDQALDYTRTTSRHGGLLVARHGWLVYEKYFGQANREVTPNMASCGKAFMSVSCGIMLKEHKDRITEGLETKVFTGPYLPEALPLSDPRKADIKFGHLLAMTSGMAEGAGIGIVRGGNVRVEAPPPGDPNLGQDEAALRARMWSDPGGGYFYSSQGSHVCSIVLRHITGMELQAYIDEKLAKPMGFGGWGYGMAQRGGGTLPHTPGGGGIALRATDALRFGHLLLHNGRWGKQQLVPSEYIELCAKPSPYNVHSPFSLQFEVNQDGHVFGAPRDTFFKSGAGGFCIYAVPSLDLAVYKMAVAGAASAPYDLGFSHQSQPASQDPRDNWTPHPFNQFVDGPIDGDAGTRRTLEMVIASVLDV
ncbi:MAG TPA: serine hydrolase [Bryobacteraceae bacterium]